MPRIEFFGIARARAGREEATVGADTLGGALRAAVALCPGLEPDVVSNGRLTAGFLASLNGLRFVSDPATPLGANDTLLLLGAHAGG